MIKARAYIHAYMHAEGFGAKILRMVSKIDNMSQYVHLKKGKTCIAVYLDFAVKK